MSKKLRAPSGTDSWGSRRAAPHLGMGHVPVAVAPKHFHRLVVWDLGHNSLQKCHCMESLGVSLAFRAFLSSCSWWALGQVPGNTGGEKGVEQVGRCRPP